MAHDICNKYRMELRDDVINILLAERRTEFGHKKSECYPLAAQIVKAIEYKLCNCVKELI